MSKIHIVGAGWYGCHIAAELMADGHNVKVYEQRSRAFYGASGANPARLHLGFHYPRSHETRKMCQTNYKKFMGYYGEFTRGIPVNIYAVAKDDSMVDYGNFVQVLKDETQFIEVYDTKEIGLTNVAGAVLTGERHILINKVREYFEELLKDIVSYNSAPPDNISSDDVLIDCTFCALDGSNVDRYEPCITHVYSGPWDKAVTIMDGQFPSIYPHYEPDTVSLTSAKYTPLSKKCKSYTEAKNIIDSLTMSDISKHAATSSGLMQKFYPEFVKYSYLDSLLAVRAMPRSGADSRIWKIDTPCDNKYIVRAGKIDAVFDVAEVLKRTLAR